MKDKFKLDFIGIGAQKSATTWISNMLRQHPEVFLPEEKELQFFNEYNLFGEKRAWRYKIHGIKYYQKLFTDSNENQIKGEFSNQYMQEEKVSQYIHDTFPEIKIIAVLRNPVDRANSAYWYFREMLNNIERLTTFEEAIEKNPKEYLERGKYYKKLKPYYRLFPVKNIHIILHDNIKENPEKVLYDLCRFLEIDSIFKFESTSKKSNLAVKRKNIFLSNVLAYFFRIPDKLEIYRIRFMTDIIGKMGVRKLLNFIKKRNLEEFNYPEICSETRKKLNKYFKEDIDKLENLINKDLFQWKNK